MSAGHVVRLVACTLSAFDAEDRSLADLCRELGVAEPTEWPAEFDDAGVRNWFRKTLVANPAAAGWLAHYVIAELDGQGTLVGSAGYKGPPGADASVEIGYAIAPAYRRIGIGFAAVSQLLLRAFGDPRVTSVTAETPEIATASRGLLAKCGFRTTGRRFDPDDGALVCYAIGRSQWPASLPS